LYRSNHQARVFETQLRNQRVPYLLSGGQSFFDKAEIKDLIAYLRLLANEDDDPAFIRAATTPKRGIGATTMETLGRYAGERHLSLFAALFEEGFAQHVQSRQLEPVREFGNFINRMQHRAQTEPAHQVLGDLLGAINYEAHLYDHEETRAAEAKWANVMDFAAWINKRGEEDGKTLVELAQSIALINMLDKEDSDYDAVQLSTLHAAKGLEYKHVFLTGVEEGILPHRESVDAVKVEEERRLMYVGITRAQRTLHISWCERRKQQREFIPCQPSRFIAEMGKEDIRFSGGKADAPPDKVTSSHRLAALKDMLATKK
ncbi:MAG TPA: 3'-5' exonuclease, partial [Rhodocyclaceae bacterium]|nr:3'-5' exonuclease [Rhodocyclaceae bacterium]